MKDKNSTEWSGKSRGGSFGYLFFIYMIKYLGVRSAYLFLALVVVYFVPFAPKATSAIWFYYREIHGYGVFRTFFSLFSHYYVFGQTMIDKIAVGNGMADRYTFEFENYDEFLRVLDSGKGAVMIGAHVGSWEMGGSFFGDYARRMNVVMYDAEYQKIKEILERASNENHYKIIPVNEGGIESVLAMKSVIDRGDYLCFQGDRYISKNTAMTGVFMGHEALFPKGPFVIASKFGVPVVFYFATRQRGMRYKFEFTIASESGKVPQELLFEKYRESLEEVVKKNPRQWFNFYKFWGVLPHGE